MSFSAYLSGPLALAGRFQRLATRIAVAAAVLGIFLAAATPAAAVLKGTADGSAHPYVGETFDGNEYCSGSLISATVFVTAAHCSPPSSTKFATDPLTGAQRMALTFDPQGFPNDPADYMNTSLTVFGDYYPDPRFTFTPAKNGLVQFDSHDVGVVILDHPIPASVTHTFAALPAIGEVNTLPQKALVTLVGYGIQAFLRGGGQPQPAQLFTRDTAPSTIVQSNDRLSPDFLKLSAGGNGQVCNGDSGGPDLLGATNVMLAENSFVNGDCSSVAYANRLDTPDARDFIAATIAAHPAT